MAGGEGWWGGREGDGLWRWSLVGWGDGLWEVWAWVVGDVREG